MRIAKTCGFGRTIERSGLKAEFPEDTKRANCHRLYREHRPCGALGGLRDAHRHSARVGDSLLDPMLARLGEPVSPRTRRFMLASVVVGMFMVLVLVSTEEFGDNYWTYREATRKLIPLIYWA